MRRWRCGVEVRELGARPSSEDLPASTHSTHLPCQSSKTPAPSGITGANKGLGYAIGILPLPNQPESPASANTQNHSLHTYPAIWHIILRAWDIEVILRYFVHPKKSLYYKLDREQVYYMVEAYVVPRHRSRPPSPLSLTATRRLCPLQTFPDCRVYPWRLY